VTLAAERLQTLEELRVGEFGELHASVLHPEFPRAWTPRGRAIARERLPAVTSSRKSADTTTSAQGRLLARTFARQARPRADDSVNQNRLAPRDARRSRGPARLLRLAHFFAMHGHFTMSTPSGSTEQPVRAPSGHGLASAEIVKRRCDIT
jgi:hypothetical protein